MLWKCSVMAEICFGNILSVKMKESGGTFIRWIEGRSYQRALITQWHEETCSYFKGNGCSHQILWLFCKLHPKVKKTHPQYGKYAVNTLFGDVAEIFETCSISVTDFDIFRDEHWTILGYFLQFLVLQMCPHLWKRAYRRQPIYAGRLKTFNVQSSPQIFEVLHTSAG